MVAVDLTLASMSVSTLQSFAEIDEAAIELHRTVLNYLHVMQDAVGDALEKDLRESTEEDGSVDYLFAKFAGRSTLHKAARDLLCLVQHPFRRNLELAPKTARSADVPFNWMEASAGAPLEWIWERDNRNLASPSTSQDPFNETLLKPASKLSDERV